MRRTTFICVLLATIAACDFAPRPQSQQQREQGAEEKLRRKAAQGVKDEYTQELLTWRAERDQMFKNDVNSPLSTNQKNFFRGMAYFPVDTTYRMEARVLPVDDTSFFAMKHTNGRDYKFRRFCRLRFQTQGDTHTLTAYQSARSLKDPRYRATLFVPFTDATNGSSTYGGGRYLDVARPTGNDSLLTIDFNRAYNPYCAYNSEYACPIPPGENRLSIPIKAGEKAFGS